MTFKRLTLAPALKHARALTLCTAAIAGVAVPTIASAATVGSTDTAAIATTAAVAQTGGAARANAVAVSSASPASAPSGSATSTYTVAAGDTLYGIAQNKLGSGGDYNKLFQLNKNRSEPGGATLTDPSVIGVGWTLLVPAGGGATTSATTASTASTATTATTATTTSATSTTSTTTQARSASTVYANNLNGWINQAISVLSAHGYSVSYNAIYQTAMNESSGNPSAVNGWDSNAAAGTPSIGLMQVIQPTFNAYALSGYNDIYNPVDNIIAAAVYAQHTYGGLDNVVAARCGGSCWRGY